MHRPRLIASAPAWVFLALFFVVPLLVVLRAADTDAWAWLTGAYVRRNLLVAIVQALLSVVATFTLAAPLAWLHHRRALPWRRVHLALHAAPFVLPVFVVVGAMRALFGPFGWISQLAGTDLLAAMGPLFAVVLAHAYYNYGFAARFLTDALDRRPQRLETAAALLRAGPLARWRRVAWPSLAPEILGLALLVFVFAFSSFGVVLLLGAGQVQTLDTMLYGNLLGVRVRLPRAAVLGILQLAINGGLLWTYMRLHRRGAQREEAPARAAPRPWHHVVSGAALALGTLPAVAVLLGGFRLAGAWSLEPWRSLVDAGHPDHRAGFDLWHAIDLSLWYAGWTLILSLALVTAVAYGRRHAGLEWLGGLPLGASSVLVGFALMITYGAGDLVDLRGTMALVVIAHTLVVFPFVARAVLPAFDGRDRRLDDAAAILGASPWRVAWRVHAPSMRGPLIVAAGFAVALSLGDFGASLLLMRQDLAGLSVWIDAHDAPFRPIAHAQMLALSGLLMAMTAVAYTAIEAFRKETV